MENAGKKLIVLYFSAKWCGPCTNIAPHVNEFAEKYESQVVVLKLDVDKLNDLAMYEYQVSKMPTFIFIKDGKTLHRLSDANAGKIEEAIKKFA